MKPTWPANRPLIAIIVILLVAAGACCGAPAPTHASQQITVAFDRDPGVDYCIVNVRTILLEPAYSKGESLLTLHPGDLLILINRQPIDRCYDVIDFATAREGFVKIADVKLIPSAHPVAYTPVPAPTAATTDSSTIDVEIDNAWSYPAHVKLGDQHLIVPAHGKTNVTLVPGEYAYYVAAPYVIPEFGVCNFDENARYTWTLVENAPGK